MSADARYPVGTLTEMAAIPDDALPRFLSELPSMIASIKQVLAAAHEANSAAGGDILALACPNPVWIDDGEQHQRVTLTPFGKEDEMVVLRDTFPEE